MNSSFVFFITINFGCFVSIGEFAFKPVSFERMSANFRNLLPEGDTQANRIVDLVIHRFNNKSFEAEPKNVRFFLWTRLNIENPTELFTNRMDVLSKSTYNSSKPVKVVIHGFDQNGLDDKYAALMRSAYLTAQDVNVITVDWRQLASFPKYARAAKSIQSVGEFVAKFLDFLAEQGTPVKSIHVIGFSLGAHVAGSAGNSLRSGRLGRITGLDPASAGFQWPDNLRRLNTNDADFVDVVHSNCKILIGFGVWSPIGHADFYPNGGRWQHGCALGTLLQSVFCSHARAFQYFVESILMEPGVFTSTRCSHFSLFNAGFCGFCRLPTSNGTPVCAAMGEHAPPTARGTYFLYTNAFPPFAIEERNPK